MTSKLSFDMIKIIRDKILNYTGTDWVPIVIVGNKSDLHGQRQISTEEGEELAALWNCQSCETSAKHNENIGMSFYYVWYSQYPYTFLAIVSVCVFVVSIHLSVCLSI